jgi:chaperonin GroES
MKLRPLHDRLLVERVDEDAPTKGAIIIPDSAKEKPQQGMVIAAGTGSRPLIAAAKLHVFLSTR